MDTSTSTLWPGLSIGPPSEMPKEVDVVASTAGLSSRRRQIDCQTVSHPVPGGNAGIPIFSRDMPQLDQATGCVDVFVNVTDVISA
jgi:hypothetical protein